MDRRLVGGPLGRLLALLVAPLSVDVSAGVVSRGRLSGYGVTTL